MSGNEENGDSAEVSFVKALSEFMALFPSVPKEQKSMMKTVLLPCFNFWFDTRDNLIKSLLDWANEADTNIVETSAGMAVAETVADIAVEATSAGTEAARSYSAQISSAGKNVSAFLHAAFHIASSYATGAKAAKAVETKRIIDEVNRALQQDRVESKALENLVNRYFRPDGQKEDQAVKVLVESTRNGAFNSVVQQTTLKHLLSTYESYIANKRTLAHMLSACFAALNELQINETVDIRIKEKIAQFLRVNTVVVAVAQLCTKEVGEIIIQCYVGTFPLPNVDSFLGIAIQSVFSSCKIKGMFDYASRPGLSRDIRAIVADLRSVRNMLHKIREVIQDVEL